jgi:ectoine hydroxylase-related dioxygenase (phytanoyl-CoA dioxygenase family)
MEDIQKDSGELVLVPKSHKFDIFKYSKFGCTKPKSLDEIKKNYSIYEDWVKDLIKRNGLEVKKIYPKKNETIIWDANLLHGGACINNNNKTRKSFVIHYTFKKVNFFYNPTFSFFKDDQDFNKRTHSFF